MTGKVCVDITMSLDGFIAGPNDGPGNGLGDGGDRLHEWIYGLSSWRELHGLDGGESNQDSELLDEAVADTGAIIVGKRMFDAAEGWGDDPPFKVPVFVLTHETREPLTKGETTFSFVEGDAPGILQQARAAADGKNVAIGGGANVVQQFLNAGLIDELHVHIAPMFLSSGVRLFEGIAPDLEVETTKVVDSPRVTHLKFRVSR